MATDVKYATQEKSVKVRNVLLVVCTNISKVTLSKLSNNIQVQQKMPDFVLYLREMST